jgi:hypothetical protein
LRRLRSLEQVRRYLHEQVTAGRAGPDTRASSSLAAVPQTAFVPADFDPPAPPLDERFVLEPLGPQHNESDYAAWTSSIDHIRSTPGYPDGRWPYEMTLEDNRGDLERHADDFAKREGFTYSVLDPASGEVIGCVYIYPAKAGGAEVLSWVRADRAALDVPLYHAVRNWLAESWPYERVEYAARGDR